MIRSLDHVLLEIPSGGEDAGRDYYIGLLGMSEVPKPPALAARGGVWLVSGAAEIHLGTVGEHSAAPRAHPCLVVDDLDGLRELLESAGYACVPADNERPGIRRFHTRDCFGNRLEFQQGAAG